MVQIYNPHNSILNAHENNNKVIPKNNHNLSKLKTICSTGSPLSEDGFRYVYNNIKEDVHLASISGGTDIVSCFVLGNLFQPVKAGEIQNRGLGMDVDVIRKKIIVGHVMLILKMTV